MASDEIRAPARAMARQLRIDVAEAGSSSASSRSPVSSPEIESMNTSTELFFERCCSTPCIHNHKEVNKTHILVIQNSHSRSARHFPPRGGVPKVSLRPGESIRVYIQRRFSPAQNCALFRREIKGSVRPCALPSRSQAAGGTRRQRPPRRGAPWRRTSS